MTSAWRLARFILSHPLAGRRPLRSFARMARWQLGSRLLGMPAVMPFVPPTRLLVQRGLSSATATLYAGLTDLADMAFALHLLREGDVMGDIGANIGVYAVLAAGVAGAQVVAVEPAPANVAHLMDNLRLNDLASHVRVVTRPLGERAQPCRVTTGRGTTNRILLEGEAETAAEMSLATLDEVFAGQPPLLLKIDTEGYECRILRGGAATLRDPACRALIVETGPHLARYGDTLEGLDGLLRGHGFLPCDYDPATRRLTGREGCNAPNTLYLRDLDFIRQRLATAPPFTIHDAVF